MPLHRWILTVAGLLLCAGSGLPAAPAAFQRGEIRYRVQTWENDDGLPQNSVISIAQTRDGYLWLGTLNGLARFDGLQFTVFDEVNTPGLVSSRVFHLFEDSRRRLWIGTENAGVAMAHEGRATGLGIGRGSRMAAACEDPAGGVWFYFADGQLWRYQDGATNAYQLGPSNRRFMIMEDSGLLWVGTDGALFGLRPGQTLSGGQPPIEQTLSVANLDGLLASRGGGGYWRLAGRSVQRWTTNRLERDLGRYPWGAAQVSALCEDRHGNLVVGTLGAGVFWFDAQGGAACLSTTNGLSHNSVLSLCLDSEGAIWVGTDGGGLNQVKPQAFSLLEPTAGRTVQSVCEDKEGGLWIGFNEFGAAANGAALWKNGEFKWHGPAEGLMNASVWGILADAQGRVWAGTWGGLYQYEDGRFQRTSIPQAFIPVVLALHQDRRGRLWLGAKEGLFCLEDQRWSVYRQRQGLSSDDVRAVIDDGEGGLWVGTGDAGLNRFHDGQFTAIRASEGGLPGDEISSLHLDAEGVLWVGTVSRGLGRFHRGRWTRFTTRQGLVSNSIGHLVEDGDGWLWIGSNAGLMRVGKKSLNDLAEGLGSNLVVRVFEKADGLPTRECVVGSQPGAFRARDGRLWFPTIKGLAWVDPARLKPNPQAPPVVIESVFIEGVTTDTNSLRTTWPEAVVVPPRKGRIEIHYTSLNLGAPDRARFRHRLEDHEAAWTDAGRERVARYGKLPPGRYRFQVSACNEDGVWNEQGASLALVVQPPFWRTWWFLTLLAALLFGSVVAVVHYLSTQRLQRQLEGMRQKEALEKERARIARDIHDQLGASLTQVSLLGEMVEIDKDAPDEVATHARQITQTARETSRALDEIVWTVNPSNDTLDGLVNYVCKNAQEYLATAGLRYRLDVPDPLPATPISPEMRHNVFLAAREAITNVVRHAQATAVWVRLKLDPGSFTLEIQDDGRGLGGMDPHRAAARNGLKNMRKRMEDVGGSFTLTAAPERGAVVRLTAPLSRNDLPKP